MVVADSKRKSITFVLLLVVAAGLFQVLPSLTPGYFQSFRKNFCYLVCVIRQGI